VPRDIRAAIVIVDRVELVLIAALVMLALADRAVGGSSGGLFAPRDPSL
jgi:hypothetical protein